MRAHLQALIDARCLRFVQAVRELSGDLLFGLFGHIVNEADLVLQRPPDGLGDDRQLRLEILDQTLFGLLDLGAERSRVAPRSARRGAGTTAP
jgi:hypothetical protein